MSHHYIRFDEVRYRYPDGYEALKGVSLLIRHGEKVALLGANGAGKSTLLLHAAGLLLPTSGEVIVGGIKSTRRTMPQIRRAAGLVFQNADDQLSMPTVEEDVAFGPANMRLTQAQIDVRVAAALAAVGATAYRQMPSHRLSGGMKKSVSIATVLAMEPSVLVMDEPTAGLDAQARRRIVALLERFEHTMIVATHDMDMAADLCERTIILDNGIIAADGAACDILSDNDLLQRCGLEMPCRFRHRCRLAGLSGISV